MNDHNCQGASCACWDDTAYKPPRKSKYRAASTPFSQSIPGSNGVQGIGTRPHPGDVPLTPEGAAYKAKLWKETEISLRDFPERWKLQSVTETQHHQMKPFAERMRRGGS